MDTSNVVKAIDHMTKINSNETIFCYNDSVIILNHSVSLKTINYKIYKFEREKKTDIEINIDFVVPNFLNSR